MIERASLSGQVFTLSGVLSADECRLQMDRAQMSGFETQGYGSQPAVDVRRRAVVEDAELAEILWKRMAIPIPPLETLYVPPLEPDPPAHAGLDQYRPIGLNSRLRFYRYEPGERFPRHFDIAYEESPQVRSFLTVIIYLNEGCSGGQTNFDGLSVNPRAGMALIFPHELPHEGAEIRDGWKCVLRSDVMYRLRST